MLQIRPLTRASVWLGTLILSAFVFFSACQNENNAEPTEGEQEGGAKKYFEQSRHSALGDDWEKITQENFEKATQARLYPKEDLFAGGLLDGNWYERGTSNVAGSIVATAFYPTTEEVYAVSQSGILIKGGLTGGSWSILSDAIKFNSAILAVVTNGGGKRIITVQGKRQPYYSDDEGATWTQAGGSFTSVDDWGSGGLKIVAFSNGTLFYLQHLWSSSPWGESYKLYRSTDNGASWSLVQQFMGSTDDNVRMWSPFNSNDLYVISNKTALYKLSGTASSLTTLQSSMSIPSGSETLLTGYQNGSNLTLYAVRGGASFYKSTDDGASWASVSTLNPTAWGVGISANPWVTDAVYYGAVDFWKSSNAGNSWASQNGWAQYYSNIDKLHADMMSVTPYQKTDGTKFFLIGNHGGIHYFPDPFTTTTNITKTNCRITDYYDVITLGSQIIAGAQDQGFQRFAGSSGTGILTGTQIFSGDYVRQNTSLGRTKYWQEYPQTGSSCTIHYFDNLTSTGTSAQGSVYGTSNTYMQYWVSPTCDYGVTTENSILVGGGGANSGSTVSKVVKMTYNGTSSLTKTEYAFDFYANGGGFITALDHSQVDPNYMYVALSNGKFYYSHDAGSSFTQTSGLTGPTNEWTYGAFIHASKLNKNLAFYCGKGGKVYKTSDGGVNFTDISTGLPNSFISELVLNPSETLLFAATDAGPYVYVLNTNTWYSMATATTPVVSFTAVEYVSDLNVVRFATYGRGVWDFQINAQPLPVTYKSFDAQATDNQQVSIRWETQTEQNLNCFEVEKSTDGHHFTKLQTVKAFNKASIYSVIDERPVYDGINYYRVKSIDAAGKSELTTIKSVKIEQKGHFVSVYPTVLQNGTPLSIQLVNENQTFYLFDSQGRNLVVQKLNSLSNQVLLPNLSNGVYYFSIKDEKQRLIKNGKLMMM
ncbi:MAG: T9SS type A sorting domain-containing protein [Saprospiraceae bacterium]|nr:T9SS type A sorting domain-containing protein [Saprospiraceae bacterium]